jgi:hypothetical protein
MQPDRAVQPLIQIHLDLPVTQPIAIFGLDFQLEILPDALPGLQRVVYRTNIPTTLALYLGDLDIDTPQLHRLLVVGVPVAWKILELMAAALVKVGSLCVQWS